jgi:hypothetical protein
MHEGAKKILALSPTALKKLKLAKKFNFVWFKSAVGDGSKNLSADACKAAPTFLFLCLSFVLLRCRCLK